MDNENKKLTPMKFLSDTREMPWGTLEYKLADLGFVDSLACEGWLKGNSLSDIMQTYLDRVVGETSFDWYGTQFPVMVKRLQVKGRKSLHVNPDDESAEQRYDAFGKTALWYVEEAGENARLYLGFKEAVSAENFYHACLDQKVEPMLNAVTPKVGESYLIPPGMVHAAQDVTLLEVAECSELWFRLYDWGPTGRELHLEESFDLIDLRPWKKHPAGPGGILAATPQFTATRIQLKDALKIHRDEEDTFLLYLGLKGKAAVQESGVAYRLKADELVLVPADVSDFCIIPEEKGTELLEVRMDPRPDDDLVSEPVDEDAL